MVRNILELLEILSLLYAFATVYGEKLEYNIKVVLFLVTQIVLMIGLNDYGFPKYFVSVSYLIMLLYCLFNYQCQVVRAIINIVISVIVLGISQLMIYFLLSTLMRDNNSGTLMWEFLTMLMCFIISVFLLPKLHLKEISDFLMKHKKILLIVGCFALVAFGQKVWKIKETDLTGKDVIYVIYFFTLLLLLLWEWQQARNDADKKRTQLEMNRLYYNAYDDLICSVREKQHDFKNHMNAIEGMLYTIDDYDELIKQERNYIDSILKNNDKTSILTMNENPLIAGFMSEKIHYAEEMGIDIEHHCIWKNKDINIPEYKLVEMFGILMDNAIEALGNYDENAYMNVNLSCGQEVLIFDVTNQYSNEMPEDLKQIFKANYSSKGKNRGIGLSKLQRMVEEFGGEVSTESFRWKGTEAIKIGFCIPI